MNNSLAPSFTTYPLPFLLNTLPSPHTAIGYYIILEIRLFWGGDGGEEIKGPVQLRVKELLRVGMGVGASAEKVWKSETNTL